MKCPVADRKAEIRRQKTEVGVRWRFVWGILGACRIIGIFAQIEANSKKLPEAYTKYSEDNFFEFNEDMGKKGIIRQAPSESIGRGVQQEER